MSNQHEGRLALQRLAREQNSRPGDRFYRKPWTLALDYARAATLVELPVELAQAALNQIGYEREWHVLAGPKFTLPFDKVLIVFASGQPAPVVAGLHLQALGLARLPHLPARDPDAAARSLRGQAKPPRPSGLIMPWDEPAAPTHAADQEQEEEPEEPGPLHYQHQVVCLGMDGQGAMLVWEEDGSYEPSRFREQSPEWCERLRRMAAVMAETLNRRDLRLMPAGTVGPAQQPDYRLW